MSPIDPERFRIKFPRTHIAFGQKIGAHRSTPFLKGPVPLPWLQAAASLPGKSLHAGVALWYLAGLQRTPQVLFSNVLASKFAIDRSAKQRALVWLQGAGLIEVVNRPGRSSVVKLLEVQQKQSL